MKKKSAEIFRNGVKDAMQYTATQGLIKGFSEDQIKTQLFDLYKNINEQDFSLQYLIEEAFQEAVKNFNQDDQYFNEVLLQ